MQKIEYIEEEGWRYKFQPPLELEDELVVRGVEHAVALAMAQRVGTQGHKGTVSALRAVLEVAVDQNIADLGVEELPQEVRAMTLSHFTDHNPTVLAEQL